MPIRRDTPRESFARTELRALEKYRLALASTELNTSILGLCLVASMLKGQKRWKLMELTLRLAAALVETVDVNWQLASIPRRQSPTCGDYKNPDDFDHSSFYEQFRFRKAHFWMFLEALGWLHADGSPICIRFGRKRHRYRMQSSHLMMIFLRRLAFPSRWVDLNLILGGSTTTSSDAYNFTLRLFYHKYVPLIQDIKRWRHKFPQFAERLAQMGAPYDNLVSFVDGHFDATARPGGDACVNRNVWDYQMYNPLHKDHGIMYQGLIHVNCIAMCFGPFAGNDHDAKTVHWANIITDMHEISQELGSVYSHFADSAYPQSRYMQVIQKAPQGGQLSRAARRFNALMARFRVYIENLFAETDSVWASLQHKQNKKIGRQDVSKMFPCAIFLHNVRTLCYGNQTACAFGMDNLLEISLKDFIETADL